MSRVLGGGLVLAALVMLSFRDLAKPATHEVDARAEPPPVPRMKASFMGVGPTLKFLYCYS